MKITPEIKADYDTDKTLKRLADDILTLEKKKKDHIRIINANYVVRRMVIVRKIGERKRAIQNIHKNRLEEQRNIEWRRRHGYHLYGSVLCSVPAAKEKPAS